MTADSSVAHDNSVAFNGDVSNVKVTSSRESDRRRRRRNQKKKKNNIKASQADAVESDASVAFDSKDNANPKKQVSEKIVIEYVTEQAEFEDEFNDEFKEIFEKFKFREPIAYEDDFEDKEDVKKKVDSDSDSDEEDQDNQQNEKGIYNKKKKLQRRMNIAELKQVSGRPDVVEGWDATSADPKLLVFLKSYRNTVPVPRHWSQKRKYLQRMSVITLEPGLGKRGVEKAPFHLPDFIAATGIEKIRQAYVEKEDGKKLKQKQRERMQPKMGKMNIDYQVLHDAFFKYQTKPKLSNLGDLYFEGKEFDMKEALGMPDGAHPPWLITMQRCGPPPSYPHLIIPGLNAPIPPGASFGYSPGEWGQPPVDEFGRPLYGDVFGAQQQDQLTYEDEPIDKSKHWGDIEEEEEKEEVEVEEEHEEEMDEDELEDGSESVDTLSSTPTGIETPDAIELRKEQSKERGRTLYQVLEEKGESVAPGTLLGTTHTYVINTGGTRDKTGAKRVDLLRGQRTDRVEVSLRPEELDSMDNVLPARYEEAREAEKLRSKGEDFSDMVAENSSKRRKKMDKEGKKKKKDFKF